MAQPDGAWVEAVRRIVAAVRASDVAELELAHGGFRVRLRREGGSAPPPSAESDPAGAQLHLVLAPLTGIFYRAPTPSTKPYASEGDWVDADAVIGLVETMKVFNEVTADRAGRVIAFLAESAQLVHAGDALVSLAPAERSPAQPEPRE